MKFIGELQNLELTIKYFPPTSKRLTLPTTTSCLNLSYDEDYQKRNVLINVNIPKFLDTMAQGNKLLFKY